MITHAISYEDLNTLHGKEVCIWGTEERTKHCIKHIQEHHPTIAIKCVFSEGELQTFCGLPVYNFSQYYKSHDISSLSIIIAVNMYRRALSELIDHEVADVYVCSRRTKSLFGGDESAKTEKLQVSTLPFGVKDTAPKVPLIISEAAHTNGGTTEHYLLIDFMKQEYKVYTCDNVNIPISLEEYSSRVKQSSLPMRMTHLEYLRWKRTMHIAQLSPSRRHIAAQRYNFFHLDILDLKKDILTRWHDKPNSDGLWDYVATAAFDDVEESLYFVRWPFDDAINGMADGTNKVRCEVGKLNMDTLQAEVLAEFDFIDRIHQISISGDKRYMVFAPMRVLKTPVAPNLLKEEEVMSKLREWTVLDKMCTLDLKTGKTSFTEIPFPIPAHFELDPLDPHIFYVSTHSLLPHQDGVLIFNPGTIHRLRIVAGTSVIEKTYTHPNFIRTTQHCVFLHRGRVLIAATNQNKLEIIDAESMQAWHIHKLLDDPIYDNANFDDPEFLKKPYSLPSTPDHCDSISASADGEYLVLRMKRQYVLFSLAQKEIVGEVAFPEHYTITTHARFYMQNSLQSVANSRWSALWSTALV